MPPKIAIIGSGIAGSTAAYYIKKLIPECEITLFEKNDKVGGRMDNFTAGEHIIETGASIYHEQNQNIANFVKEFDLPVYKPYGEKSYMGIWDGSAFAYQESSYYYHFINSAINMASGLWRYGLSPRKLPAILDDVLAKFMKMYELKEPFTSTEEAFQKVGLLEETKILASQYFREQGLAPLFVKEIIGFITRVNYCTDVNKLSALAALVAAAGANDEKLYAVTGGNRTICEGCVSRAGCNVKLSTKVDAIRYKDGRAEVEVSGHTDVFDGVILAAPLELANIDVSDLQLDSWILTDRKYQEVHATFVLGDLNPTYFGTTFLPDLVFTIEDPRIPFMSIGQKKSHQVNGRSLFKVFSRRTLTDEEIGQIFINPDVINRKPWFAYPVLTPTERLPPLVLKDNIWYANAFESAVSTMETESISGKNIAKLVAKKFGRSVEGI